MFLAGLLPNVSWRWVLFGLGSMGSVLSILFFTQVAKHVDSSSSQLLLYNDTIHREDIIHIIKNPQNWILSIYNGLAFSPVEYVFRVMRYFIIKARVSGKTLYR